MEILTITQNNKIVQIFTWLTFAELDNQNYAISINHFQICNN